MTEIEEILEALDLPRAGPGLGYLRSVFARFNERVPFETASKIVRNAEVAKLRDKPRRPPVFWADHLARGTGGTCYARAAAFEALLAGLGFSCRAVLGRVESDFDHAALLVAADGREWIADAGFPLPAILPCREGETESALGSLRVQATDRGWRVDFLEGVPEGPRGLELFREEVSMEEFSRHWAATFRPGSKFLESVSLRIQRPGRVVSFALGEIRVDDLHSRTRIPVSAPRAPVLQETFGVDAGLLERALALSADPEPASPLTQVCVYLESDGPPSEAFGAIGTPEGYRDLMAGAATVISEESTAGGWKVRLRPPGADSEAGSVEERIILDPKNLCLRIRRGGQESTYEAAIRAGRTFLVRRLFLSGPRLDLLRNDSLRGRFAGSLAVDLLAWARLLGRSGV
jgi:arylamine N-acetyltransferase